VLDHLAINTGTHSADQLKDNLQPSTEVNKGIGSTSDWKTDGDHDSLCPPVLKKACTELDKPCPFLLPTNEDEAEGLLLFVTVFVGQIYLIIMLILTFMNA